MDGEGMYFLDYDNKSIVEVGNDFKELQQRFKISLERIEETNNGYHVYFDAKSREEAINTLLNSKCDPKYKYYIINALVWQIGLRNEKRYVG